MDRSNIVYLIGTTYTFNDYGVQVPEHTRRAVYCAVDSVTRAEFFDAGRNGLNPEYRITMFYGDYAGESVVEYQGKTYVVYRTYHAKTDELELYVQREGGTNGSGKQQHL